MRSRPLFGLGMGLTISAILWFTQCHGTAATQSGQSTFCGHVQELSTVLLQIGGGSASGTDGRLERLAREFDTDAGSFSEAGDSTTARQAGGLAPDLTQCREA